MNKIILGFVGPMSAGKGTACQYLKEKYGASTYRFSTMLRDILDRLYIPQERNNMQNISLALRQTFGDDLLAKVIANDVSRETNAIIGIDGVRRQPDIKFLKDIAGFHLVEITADQKIRWQRMTNRGENPDDAKKTFEQFAQDEQKEAERQIADVAKYAEYHINNNGSFDQLYRQIDDIVNKLNESKN